VGTPWGGVERGLPGARPPGAFPKRSRGPADAEPRRVRPDVGAEEPADASGSRQNLSTAHCFLVTVTGKEQTLVLPRSSRAVQVTNVVPMGNRLPGGTL